MSHSIGAAQHVFKDLELLLIQFTKRPFDTTQLLLDFEKWKRRAVESLSEFVPPDDLTAFKQISTRPHFEPDSSALDSIRPLLDHHAAYLRSTLKDMKERPRYYGEDAVRRAKRLARKGKPQALQATGKVTAAWLLKNVGVPVWIWFFALLLGAFALGMRVGMIPHVVRWLGPLIGVNPQ